MTSVSFDGVEVNQEALRALFGEPPSPVVRIEWERTEERSEYRRIVRDGLQAAFPDLVLPPFATPVTRRIVVPRARLVELDEDGEARFEVEPEEIQPWTP